MGDFKIVINDKERYCIKCDKVYIEPDSSTERSDIDRTKSNSLIESFNIQIEPISYTIHIKKKIPIIKEYVNFLISYPSSIVKIRTDEERLLGVILRL